MKKYRVYQVDAFTKIKLAGNPAGVVTNAEGLTEKQMQTIARELNNSETAFILPPTKNQADIKIRFFTPTTEVPICGHATIGANFVRAIENNLDSQTIIQETGAGNLPIEISKRNNTYQIMMTQGDISVAEPLDMTTQSRILNALGLTPDQRNQKFPMAIASTGAAKVMIAIDSESTLDNLKPDLEALKSITPDINCNGYYVFVVTPDEEHLIHGRMFSPASGINEDPVTGNANGPLGAYLVKYNLVKISGNLLEFSIIQGEKIKRPGTMLVRVFLNHGQPVKIQIVGEAVIAFKTEIYL
ncbi:PhzF family isomerase [Companilactobacillus zhachilii]|uniref:PhzF family isomerase n=1 Tax=Companilactobacillus zhachilii TaxID=2304606 RepID=UPI0019238F6E|nr:PhzF family isomerase [Companilactobacillus zhachilii]MBL3530807.1 PhzF family isomerase [Companilactobacillus zhachilii]